MSVMVRAKATAAGGAPTSALAVESESKLKAWEEGGGRDYAEFFRHFLPSAIKHLTSQPCNVPTKMKVKAKLGRESFFLVVGVHLPRQWVAWRQLC